MSMENLDELRHRVELGDVGAAEELQRYAQRAQDLELGAWLLKVCREKKKEAEAVVVRWRQLGFRRKKVQVIMKKYGAEWLNARYYNNGPTQYFVKETPATVQLTKVKRDSRVPCGWKPTGVSIRLVDPGGPGTEMRANFCKALLDAGLHNSAVLSMSGALSLFEWAVNEKAKAHADGPRHPDAGENAPCPTAT